MLKVYLSTYVFTVNGKEFNREQSPPYLEEEKPNKITTEEIFSGYDFESLLTCLEVTELNKCDNFVFGCYKKDPNKKKIYFDNGDNYTGFFGTTIKNNGRPVEWSVTEITKEIEVSMERLFQIGDSEKVIQYLKERGLTVCPMAK